MWIELVDGTGRRGRLSLLDATTGDGRGDGRDPGPTLPDRPPAAQRWAGRFEKLGEQDYAVDRALVRELVTAGGQPGAVRMIPIFDHGEIKGLRLGVVSADSIPSALGLRTGDILVAIDGEPIKNLDQLLNFYVRLDQLSAVELSGTRGGKPLVRTLRLR
jgi:general secretion pathway protein C